MPEVIGLDSDFPFIQINKFAKDVCPITIIPPSPLRTVSVIQGNLNLLPPKLRKYIEEKIELCQPKNVYICNGSDNEALQLSRMLEEQKVLIPLPKYTNCWLTRTNPADVARVESKTFLCTPRKQDSVPDTKGNVSSQLGNWMSPRDMDEAIKERFPGCMRGRTMYVVPYSMGPVGSSLSKIGIQLTDSPYAVLSMRIMTRMGDAVLKKLIEDENTPFVPAVHSVGTPRSGRQEYPTWPCDPERIVVLHNIATNEIVSYGSQYGGNSLLGKKCLALRIGSSIARREGWLAEHMLILGITNSEGKKRYIAAAFPSACGKTNLAMLNPTLPGYKINVVGDDIAWMKFNSKGELRAINPENGFFGVAPGTSNATNPNAMKTIVKDTIFTNVALTSDGGVYWEGLESEIPDHIKITDWHGKQWTKGSKTPSAHPNSRFCAPARNCPILDPDWEDPEGVPIDAILFGGRRPVGVPLVVESLDWKHGVFMGASMRSESTAAAEHKGKVIMHDPFAMRPFFGYNFGHYLQHWLNIGERPDVKLPKIFHVNWFRKNSEGKFLWPGYGENIRVLDWIFNRLENKEGIAQETPIGYIPTNGALNTDGLPQKIDFDQLFAIDKDFWKSEVEEVEKWLDLQVGSDVPKDIWLQAENLKKRLQ